MTTLPSRNELAVLAFTIVLLVVVFFAAKSLLYLPGRK